MCHSSCCMQIDKTVHGIASFVDCLIQEQDELLKLKGPEQVELGKHAGNALGAGLESDWAPESSSQLRH